MICGYAERVGSGKRRIALKLTSSFSEMGGN